jgi:hypothetical protein
MRKVARNLMERAHSAMKMRASRVLVITAMAAMGCAVHAESDVRARIAYTPLYVTECSSCHLAFPPGMLPAASWQRLMGGLAKHFGTDASLDAASTRTLGAWLVANAGTYRRVSEEPPQDRITQSAWFLRKHREGEVPAGVWKRASVGSPANCAACHTGSAQGNFNENEIRIPK